jgi:hypothetical protein
MAATTGTTYMLGISINNSTGQVKSDNSGSRIKAPVKLRSTVFLLSSCRRGKTVTGKDTFVRGYWRTLFLRGFLAERSEPRDLSQSSCVFIPAARLDGGATQRVAPLTAQNSGVGGGSRSRTPRAQLCQRPARPTKVRNL